MHAVAVAMYMFGDFTIRAQRGGEYETDFALLQNIRGAIAYACFRTCVSNQLHAKGNAIVISSLSRVADVEFHVICSVKGKEVFLRAYFRVRKCRHRRYSRNTK